jgi:hypothetical protein
MEKSMSVRSLKKLCVTWAALIGLGVGGLARADVITTWHEIATNAIAAAPASERPSAGIHWAMVHSATYDAANGILRTHTPLNGWPAGRVTGASVDAAVTEAAYRVLIALFPSQTAILDSSRATSLAAIADGAAKTRGIQIGAEMAARELSARQNDGRLVDVPYVPSNELGGYVLTMGLPNVTPPPGPVTPWVAQVKPFVLRKASQFRPEGPPELDSGSYAADLNEVKLLGEGASSVRTAAQTEIGMFHTMNPTLFWGRNVKAIVESLQLSTGENARLLAQLSLAYADANIACWNAKYHFLKWRPVTAIHAADTDGNAGTDAKLDWYPLTVTPPHPEYPAAHGCAAGSVMETLRRFLGTRYIDMTFISSVAGSVPHHFDDTADFLDEIVDARIYGGMHFRTSVEDGEEMGRQVARYVARHALQPLPGCDRWSRHQNCGRGRND